MGTPLKVKVAKSRKQFSVHLPSTRSKKKLSWDLAIFIMYATNATQNTQAF